MPLSHFVSSTASPWQIDVHIEFTASGWERYDNCRRICIFYWRFQHYIYNPCVAINSLEQQRLSRELKWEFKNWIMTSIPSSIILVKELLLNLIDYLLSLRGLKLTISPSLHCRRKTTTALKRLVIFILPAPQWVHIHIQTRSVMILATLMLFNEYHT